MRQNGVVLGSRHTSAIDKSGNMYVGEVDSAKRIQKFAPVLTNAR